MVFQGMSIHAGHVMHENLISSRLLVGRLSLKKPWRNAHTIVMVHWWLG